MSFINLFKSISSFQFPYTLDDKPVHETALWQVFNGSRKSDSLPVSVFKANRSQESESLILNAVHKSRVLKIPGLCHVLETFDSDPQSTFIVTERVTPFPWDEVSTLQRNTEGLAVGIYQVLTTLKFLNAFVFGSISKESIFIDSKGQWLLFGLELCTKISDVDNADAYMTKWHNYNRLMGFQVTSERNFKKVDAIQLGALISTIFGNGARIPKDWQSPIQNLSQGRTTIENFMQKLQSTNTWISNPLITVYQQLKELHIKEPQEKLAVMNNLQNSFFETRNLYHNLSPGFVEGLLVPEIANVIKWLITSQNNSASSLSKIIPLLAIFLDLTTNKQFYPENSKQLIYDCFALQDRQVRFLLLIYLTKISDYLDKNEIANKIYPRFIQGMADSDPTLRLQTLKSIPVIVPYITERQLNNELLRYLAKTQVDSDVEIRTWTVIIITRISTLLSTSSGNRSNILATAYTKSLKDPTIKPRLAALYGLAKSIDLFDVATIANKILTVIAPGLLDKDPLVRSKAKDLFQKYLNKLESEAKTIQKANADGSQSDDIDFDQYGNEENSDDAEIVKQFMATLMLSSSPEPTFPLADTDQNYQGPEDAYDESKKSSIDGDAWDIISDGSTIMPERMDKKNSLNGNPVAIEKSWNSDFNENEEPDDFAWDDQSLWEEPKPALGDPKKTVIKTVKKTSILTTRKTTGAKSLPRSNRTPAGTSSSKLGGKSELKKDIRKKEAVSNDEGFEDDAWDANW